MVAMPDSLVLDPAFPVARVEAAVRADFTAHQRTEYRLCLGLRRLYTANAHRGGARASFADWAEQRLGIPSKLASLFSFLGFHFERLPAVRAAVESGALSYTKAREFVAIATSEDEKEWIERAQALTNRKLERLVAERGGKPAKVVVSPLTAKEVQDVRRAREILTTRTDAPVPYPRMLPEMSRMLAEGALVFAVEAGTAAPAKKVRPYLTQALCVNCLDTWVPVPGENLRIPLAEWLTALKDGAEVVDLASVYLCDCEGEKHRRDRCPKEQARPGGRRVSRYIRAEDLKLIEARDGMRCSTPGCTCAGPLENGHLTPFRDGTPADPEMIRKQCATCNVLVESERLVITGRAPFEEYTTANGEYLGIGYDPEPRTRSDPHVGTGDAVTREPPAGGS